VTDAFPDVRYAVSGDVHIAYNVLGDGPIDIVIVAGFLTHLGVLWEEPGYRHFMQRLASFARVIQFDKRGMGLSDRVQAGTLEERMDDVRAVLDAVGSERAALMGTSEGGPLSLLFAATYPERTRALLLVGAEVKERKTDDWPWGESTDEEFEQWVSLARERWGEIGMTPAVFAPSLGEAEAARAHEWSKRLLREAASPGPAVAFMRMAFEIDVRHVCPAISVPALVLHRVDDRVCHVENARFLARTIPGAHYVELAGGDHVEWLNPAGAEEIAAEVQEFLTGVRESPAPDRILATVLFTDIVGSTVKLAEVGDVRWRELVERHDTAVRRELTRFRGRELDTAGDAFLASFDGPARAIRCAEAIRDAVKGLGLQIRAGVHTGECEVAGDKLRGIAVHIGARVAGQASADEILASSTVRDLVAGSGIEFQDRGTVVLKGVPGEWQLYAVQEREAAASVS
jgi:pimeloyl-ACP methyl ester carboxylesterase